jgi:hypothetical protein
VLTNATAYCFRFDFDKMHARGDLLVPLLQIIGKYESEGKILLLPLNGKGDINITLGKKRTKCTMQLYQQQCILAYGSNTVLCNHPNIPLKLLISATPQVTSNNPTGISS